jgi:hypothetical protein
MAGVVIRLKWSSGRLSEEMIPIHYFAMSVSEISWAIEVIISQSCLGSITTYCYASCAICIRQNFSVF